jgi:hypothetical protein
MKRLVLLVLLVMGTLASAAAQSQDFFPLEKGTYWVYRGSVKWTSPENKVLGKAIENWKMEIAETITRDWVTAAVIVGHPSDLASYEEGREASRRVLVVVQGTKFFLIDAENADRAVQRLRSGGDDLQDLVTGDDLILELPLHTGQQIGPVETLTRQDRMNKWLVENEEKKPVAGVRGTSPSESRSWYRLIHRTDPDHQIITYVPGVGIAAYSYSHHGTVAEAELQLIEFHPAGSPPGK